MPADVARFRERFGGQCVLQIAYATTETGTIAQMAIDEARWPMPVGHVVAGTEVDVVDENGAGVEEGVLGEIMVRGRVFESGGLADGRGSDRGRSADASDRRP